MSEKRKRRVRRTCGATVELSISGGSPTRLWCFTGDDSATHTGPHTCHLIADDGTPLLLSWESKP